MILCMITGLPTLELEADSECKLQEIRTQRHSPASIVDDDDDDDESGF